MWIDVDANIYEKEFAKLPEELRKGLPTRLPCKAGFMWDDFIDPEENKNVCSDAEKGLAGRVDLNEQQTAALLKRGSIPECTLRGVMRGHQFFKGCLKHAVIMLSINTFTQMWGGLVTTFYSASYMSCFT